MNALNLILSLIKAAGSLAAFFKLRKKDGEKEMLKSRIKSDIRASKVDRIIEFDPDKRKRVRDKYDKR